MLQTYQAPSLAGRGDAAVHTSCGVLPDATAVRHRAAARRGRCPLVVGRFAAAAAAAAGGVVAAVVVGVVAAAAAAAAAVDEVEEEELLAAAGRVLAEVVVYWVSVERDPRRGF